MWSHSWIELSFKLRTPCVNTQYAHWTDTYRYVWISSVHFFHVQNIYIKQIMFMLHLSYQCRIRGKNKNIKFIIGKYFCSREYFVWSCFHSSLFFVIYFHPCFYFVLFTNFSVLVHFFLWCIKILFSRMLCYPFHFPCPLIEA